MPAFCRHGRLLQNCTICAREQNFAARPVVSSSAPKSEQQRERPLRPVKERTPRTPRQPRAAAARGSAHTVKVRRLARGADDGYRSELLLGLHSSQDAARLLDEIAYAASRLELMESFAAGHDSDDVPDAWREIVSSEDLDARTLVAVRTAIDGPRGIHDGNRGEASFAVVDAWVDRSGSASVAFTGELSWSPERRFERIFERLGSLGGVDRDIRFELLTLLGRLGLYEMRAGSLFLSGENEATWAAKRAFGIGDPLLLERRAAALAEDQGVPLEALDRALHSWGAGERVAD